MRLRAIATPGRHFGQNGGMLTRVARKFVASIGIAAIVFAQLAVSAYACPKDAAAVGADVTASADPCEHSRADSPNLCAKHCDDSTQIPTQAPAACAPFVASFVVIVRIPDAAASDAPVDPALLHATSPPATLRNCCLRI